MKLLPSALILMTVAGTLAAWTMPPEPRPPKPGAMPRFVQVRWAKFPTESDFRAYYPAGAKDDEVEGQAKVECTILNKEGHIRCAVMSERPKERGFGRATVVMLQREARVDMAYGLVKPGDKVIKIQAWALPD